MFLLSETDVFLFHTAFKNVKMEANSIENL